MILRPNSITQFRVRHKYLKFIKRVCRHQPLRWHINNTNYQEATPFSNHMRARSNLITKWSILSSSLLNSNRVATIKVTLKRPAQQVETIRTKVIIPMFVLTAIKLRPILLKTRWSIAMARSSQEGCNQGISLGR